MISDNDKPCEYEFLDNGYLILTSCQKDQVACEMGIVNKPKI